MKNDQFSPGLIVRPQTPNEELDYLWMILENMPFFREHGYSVEVPDHPEFQKLTQIAPDFSNVNKQEIEKIFIKQCYDINFYNTGLSAIEAERTKIESIFPTLIEFNQKWGFKLFPKYTIALTMYGTGGMYDSDSGKITVTTTKDGQFRRPNPAYTPIHEIIHIGIEDNIIKKFDLTHREKERLVDLIIVEKFKDLLPDYQLQSFGDDNVDKYISNKTLNDLPLAVENYIKDFPRD